MIDTSLFPYDNFPYRLSFKDKNNSTVCWFECSEHLDRYIKRYKFNTKDLIIDCKHEQSTKSSKRNKRNLEQTTKPKSNGSSGTVRTRKPSVDSPRNSASNSKRKK